MLYACLFLCVTIVCMILNTGNRTDIPAYFSAWFYNRIKEGYVLSRSPYNPQMILKYRLDPKVVDAITFCTKNPGPMLKRLPEIQHFQQLWHVTITPYGRDIEPHVPDCDTVMEYFRQLSQVVGYKAMSWRYDPIFLSQKYTVEFHIEQFRRMAEYLSGYTKQCVVSFIDLYDKTQKNFPEARTVSMQDQRRIIDAFDEIAGENHMQIHLCLEDAVLEREHVDAKGCYTQEVIESAIGQRLLVPNVARNARRGCNCLLGSDIGAYNTCGHGCRYCYANYDMELVRANMRQHDPYSPLLIGHVMPGDEIHEVEQKSWIDRQISVFDLI